MSNAKRCFNILPMHKEPVFNKGGAYRLVVEKNLGLHQEAIAMATPIVSKFLSPTPKKKNVVRVLDLACGGYPLIIAKIMAHFSSHTFEYTGVDVNSDQLDACRQFSFSSNVIVKKIIEGNAWDLKTLLLDKKMDIIFIGLNTHHGTLEEISYLTQQIFRHLKKKGLFFNHDLFRPSQYPYLKKPDTATWREQWLSGYFTFTKSQGIPQDLAKEGIDHMKKWDYPVSTEEMGRILKSVGFTVSLHSYPVSWHPFSNFYGLVAGCK